MNNSTKTQMITKEDKVFMAIEAITGKNVVSVNEEAKRYCFLLFNGDIKTIDKEFVNDLAGVC
jgi:hypothetical protein